MPQYKNPFEKGNLYVNINVTFPNNYFTTIDKIKILESVLPPRPPFTAPSGENVEEVDLMDYDPHLDRNSYSRREAYASDDEDHVHGSGVQCAHQ